MIKIECHRMKKKSCNFLMLQGTFGFNTSARERRKELECAFWDDTRKFFLLYYGDIEVIWYVSLGVCMYVTSFPPCYFFSKSWEVHEGPAVTSLHWRESYTQVFSFNISLKDYLLLQMYEKCISGRGLFFFFFLVNSAKHTVCNVISIKHHYQDESMERKFVREMG